jgi:hypothetical protein
MEVEVKDRYRSKDAETLLLIFITGISKETLAGKSLVVIKASNSQLPEINIQYKTKKKP